MRRAALVVSISLAGACAPEPSTVPASAPAPAASDTAGGIIEPGPGPVQAPPTPLAAGIYFRDHGYKPCRHMHEGSDAAKALCVTPKFVVLEGVYPTPAEADAAIASREILPLAPGYPYVAHTDELGLENEKLEGIAVVLAQFETGEETSEWIGATGVGGIAPLLDAEAAYARIDGEPRFYAARVRQGAPPPAYPYESLTTISEPGDRPAPPNPPLSCEVEPGAVIVVARDELEYYMGLPAGCDDAFVLWGDTTIMSFVYERTDGTYARVQQALAECDMPYFVEAKLDGEGALASEAELIVTSRGGC